MMCYEFYDRNGGFMVDDLQGHLLFIEESPTAVHPVHFFFEEGNGILTSARSFDAYPKDAHPIDPDHVVVEVGAGLGEFIPKLARNHKGRLTVIDPFDYVIAQAMLDFAKGLELADWQRLYVEELLERSGVYLDPNRVQLISQPLSGAPEKEPSLIGSADLVVDFYGPMHYSRITVSGNSLVSPVKDLERRLLKPSGILVAKRAGGFPQVIRP